MAWNHNQDVASAIEAFCEIRTGGQVRRKLDVWKIPLVFTVFDHRLEEVELDNTAQANVTADPGELQRQRGSPGACADDGNSLWC